MRIPPNQRVLIVGKTQSGKTTWTKSELRKVRNYIIYDTKRQYGTLGKIARSIPEILAAARSGCRRIIYWTEDLSVEHFDKVCEFIYKTFKIILFVIEEVQMFASASFIPPWFMKLITISEGENNFGAGFVGIWAITQMPVKANWDLKSQCKIIVSFRLDQKDAQDVQKVQSQMPADELMRLEKGHHIIYNENMPFDAQISRHKPIKVQG